MTTNELLALLKSDLQILSTANDTYLTHLLESALSSIQREGIEFDTNDASHQMVQIQYAAYLFRKRAGDITAMPRFLRYELNNILFAQKGNTNDV